MKWQLAKEGVFNGDQEITRQMILDIVETTVNDAPVTLGHYSWDGDLSEGWVRHETLEAQETEGVLYLVGQVDLLDNAKQLMLNEYFKNWSVSIAPESDGKFRLLHLALLGAESPAIPGLKEIAASAKSDKLIRFMFSKNTNIKDTKMNEFELKFNKLTAEFSLKKESHAIELKAKTDALDKVTLENTDLKEKAIKQDEKLKEFEDKNFSASLDILHSTMAGKVPKAKIDTLIASYKEKGLECSSTVTDQISFFSDMPNMVVAGEVIPEDNKENKTAGDFTGMTGAE